MERHPWDLIKVSLEGLNSSSEVKEKVQALLNERAILPRLEDMHKLSFVYLF